MKITYPENEALRLAKLESIDLLETPPEDSFDELTELASIVCQTPIAFISLIDKNRQWFKARKGIDACETPREYSFCTHAILNKEELTIIPDATRDPLFKDNPLVTQESGLRFYASATLVTKDGFALGTLCVADHKPRNLNEDQQKSLRLLAKRIVDLIEIREKNRQLKRFATVVDRSDNMIIITDNVDRIIYVNPVFEKITEYSFSEVKGMRPKDFLRGSQRKLDLDQKIKDATKRKDSVIVDIQNFTKTGKPFIVRSNIIPLFNDAGKLINYISVQTDITEQRRKEEELVEAKESAQESARLKQQFLSNMSHEIRTPMNGIIGLAGLLLEEPQKVDIKHIHKSAKNLLTIINDILDFSKVNAGKLSFEYKDFDLRDCFQSLQTTLGVLASEKGLDFDLQVSKDLPVIVGGDPTRFHQILMNLAGNALKFTEEGQVIIAAGLKSEYAGGYEVEVSVEDTGEGIPKDKLETIFEEFEQAKSYCSGKQVGTGLGLSIARKLIEMYDGAIDVQSEVGVGSRFTFTVKFKYPETKAQSDEPAEKERSSPEVDSEIRVLLVEDNYVNQLVTSKYLEKAGFAYDVAKNGKEAIELFRKGGYRLIIMDLQMPIMNGLDATREIRKSNQEIPIIGMTASVMQNDLDMCLKVGMNDYISKPFTPDDLFGTLAKHKNKPDQMHT